MTSEHGIYRKQMPEQKTTPELPEQNPQLEINNESTSSFKTNELGTMKDISAQQPLPQPAGSSQSSESEGLAITFSYRVQDGGERPESYFTQQIKKRIDVTNIPAGSVGVPYELVFDFTPLENDLKIIDPKPNEAFGNRGFEVTSEGNKITIKGTPRDNIDTSLNLCFREENKNIKNAGQDVMPYFRYPKPFLINPHPRELWQNLPVADYDGYQNKDSDCRGETVDYIPAKHGIFSTTSAKSFEVVAASQRGRSHAHVSKPRDDSFHFEFDKETGWNFVAVADGA
ncbi:MAG: protein phosphatase 2C domain-containing protein, partial [Planctomycetaceae bacterium]|nr:protein phosphatase 2C domain-containing protein [Planctomycetaceae bacterium]